MDVLQVKNLTKKFGTFTAVDDISFSLKEGEILGILGRNGAGKTTTIQMLLGVLTPTHGQIEYFGKDLTRNREEILEEINFSSSYTNLPWQLRVKENLNFLSYFYEIDNRSQRLDKIREIFRLDDIWKQPFGDLSAGQLTRVNLAKSFLNFPKVLLLDEPTASLDPEVAQYIREFLLEERKKFQMSIILTSHNMREVEEMTDRVLFIDQGKIIADGTADSLAKSIQVSHVELYVADGLQRVIDYCKKYNLNFTIEGRYIRIDVKEQQIAQFLTELANTGIHYTEISIDKPTLEDYFLQTARKKELERRDAI